MAFDKNAQPQNARTGKVPSAQLDMMTSVIVSLSVMGLASAGPIAFSSRPERG
jgi:hypothetical protein